MYIFTLELVEVKSEENIQRHNCVSCYIGQKLQILEKILCVHKEVLKITTATALYIHYI